MPTIRVQCVDDRAILSKEELTAYFKMFVQRYFRAVHTNNGLKFEVLNPQALDKQ
jgi:hypothetical protein